MARFAALPQIVAVIEQRERRALGVTVEGIPVELVAAPPESFGTELVRATGSAAYVGRARAAAGGARRGSPSIARSACPGVRRSCARLRPAAAHRSCVEPGDIRGDLHCHTTWSDGRMSVEEMARAGRERGYDYIAICDHTPAVGAVRGLTADDVRRQGEEIAAANALLAPFRVLRGIECDILPDGRLDLPDAVLAELDWVQASVHGGQRMPRREMTKRVEEALRNPHVRCLSHPTGRLITRRPENALDLARAYEVALEHGVALEVNGLPARLDLRGEHVADAIRAGVRIVCSTDAHSVPGLGNMTLSVHTARRGGATRADVLNTCRWTELLARRSSPNSVSTDLREHLGVPVDVGLRGRRRHERHVVERRDEDAAVEHEEMQHVLELGVVQRGARAAASAAARARTPARRARRAATIDHGTACARRARRARRPRSGRRARSSRRRRSPVSTSPSVARAAASESGLPASVPPTPPTSTRSASSSASMRAPTAALTP